MKKAALITSALLATAAAPAQADWIFGVYGEAQYWMTDTQGGYATDQSFSDIDFDDERQMRLALALHHPIPLIPNVRIESQQLETTAPLVAGGDPNVNNFDAQVDLGHETLTLYYRFLDNDLVGLHLGVSAKRFDGYVRDYSGTTWDVEETIPTGYAMVSAGLPFTGLSLYGRAHAFAFDDSELTDVEAALQYRFLDSALLDGSIQLGYRVFNIELDNVGGLYSDLEFKGPFVGLELHF
ncbi:TIGR04219 family outer membrane beta-barrel protein [Aliidiomarina sp. Khilg15.8]